MSCWVQTHSFSFSPLPFSVLTPNNTLLAEAFLPSHSLSLSLPPSISGGSSRKENKKKSFSCATPHTPGCTQENKERVHFRKSPSMKTVSNCLCVGMWLCEGASLSHVLVCMRVDVPVCRLAWLHAYWQMKFRGCGNEERNGFICGAGGHIIQKHRHWRPNHQNHIWRSLDP